MKRMSLLVLVGVMFLTVAPAFAGMDGYVRVRSPFANIYEFLDPQSRIIQQAKKGDHFELVFEGESWYQVKVQEKVGWLDKQSGMVVSSPTVTFMAVPVGTLVLFAFLLLGTLAATFIFIYRQKTSDL